MPSVSGKIFAKKKKIENKPKTEETNHLIIIRLHAVRCIRSWNDAQKADFSLFV